MWCEAKTPIKILTLAIGLLKLPSLAIAIFVSVVVEDDGDVDG